MTTRTLRRAPRTLIASILAATFALAPVMALAATDGHEDPRAELAPGTAEAGLTHDEHGGDAPHGKVRAAAEDHHWWLGQELIPASTRQSIADLLGKQWLFGDPPAKVDVGHIFLALIVFCLGIGLALSARRQVRGEVLPPAKWSPAAFFDIVVGALMGVMMTMMSREKALKHLPLMTAVAVFILFSNLLALVPGLYPPTQNLNTNLALGLIAFAYYNYQGIKTHGLGKYLAHFAGPILAIAPLMFVIEIISHTVRPLSLAIRLLGNMFGDHQVLFVFLGFSVPLLPLPIMFLGLLVCIVQTLVFTMLFIVYVALATEEHEHEHEPGQAPGHEHGAAPAHAH